MATANIDIKLSNGKQAGSTINELRQQANRLTKEVNSLKPGTEEFVRKSQDLKKVGTRLGEVRNEVKNVKTENSGLLEQFQHYIPFSGQLQAISRGFKAVNLGAKATRAALIATGIGAFVVILGSLIAYLTSTQAGMDKLTKVTRPLKAIFEVLKGVVQELGEKVFNKFSAALDDPIGAIKDLGQAILDNIINRFKALSLIGPALAKIFSGDLAGGFKDLGNAGIQMATGVTDGIEKATSALNDFSETINEGIESGTRLDELQKQIEKTEIALTVRRAELNRVYNESKEIAQDLSAAEGDRIKAAEAAIAAQDELLQREQQFIDLKIEKMKLEQSLNDTSREDQLELANLEAERINFEAQAAKKRASARSLLNTVKNGELAADKKRIKELEKAEEEARKNKLAAETNLQNLRIEQMEEGLNREVEKIWLDTDRKIEALTGSEQQITEQRIALEDLRLRELEELRASYAEKEKQREKDLANFEHKMAGIRKGTAVSITNFLAQQLASRVGNEKDAQNILKGAAIAEIGFNLQQELAANALTAAQNPLNGVTFGAAGAAQLTALNTASIVRAGIGVATVLSTNLGGGGGSTSAPPSAATSTVGASSISPASTQGVNIGGEATAAPVSRSNSGAQLSPGSTSAATQGSGEGTFNDRLLQAIQNWPKTLQVNNNLQEVENGLNVLSDTRNEADF